MIACIADAINAIYCSVVLFSVLGVAAAESGIELENIVKAGNVYQIVARCIKCFISSQSSRQLILYSL